MYKNLFLFALCIVHVLVFGQHQSTKKDFQNMVRCGSASYVENKIKNDESYKRLVEETRQKRKQIVENAAQKRLAACPNGEVLVAVAVHFDTGIGTTADEKTCLTSLVNAQMKVLNDAFNGINDAGCSTTPANGACIKFRLANKSHPPDSGLSDGEPAITFDGAYTCPNANPCNLGPWSGLLNIVVQDMLSRPGGPLGIAPLNGSTSGGGAANTFLVDLCGFGTEEVFCNEAGPNSCGAGFKYRNGNTTVHEAGHFYGLEHTFCRDDNGDLQGGSNCAVCTGSLNCDGFTDTPAQCHSNYKCYSGTCSESVNNPCGGPAIFNNFMDYLVDKCMNSFSAQQTTAINEAADRDFYKVGAIGDYTPACSFNLKSADGANYLSENSTIKICGNSTYPLEESSTNNPTGYNWIFTTTNGLKVSPLTSSLANPQLNFSGNAGILTVELNVSNDNGTCSSLSKTYNIQPSIELSSTLINCGNNNSAQVSLDVGNAIGSIDFTPRALINGATNPYTFLVNSGSNCSEITVIAEDNGISISKGNFEVIEPHYISGSYPSGTNTVSAFGISIESISPCLFGTLALVNDGISPTADFCAPEPPASPTASQCNGLDGNIAMVDRGDCFFTQKIENAQACGAIAVVMCNCEPFTENCNAGSETEVINMSGTPVNDITIPTVFVSYKVCEEIKLAMQTDEVNVCLGAERTGGCVQSITLNACDLCDENNISGCMDICASNYNPGATVDDGSCQAINISISGLPVTTFSPDPIALTGTPLGGTFSGDGIAFTFFNPSISGLGVNTITYTYINEYGCTLSTSKQILVGDLSYQFVDYQLYFDSP